MIRALLIYILSVIALKSTAQNKMRPLEDLINISDPGWTLITNWIKLAKNRVDILPVDTTKAKDALYKTQVTTRSPMGAVIYMTGGILIDKGWIRVLGSGSARLNRTLPDWNKGKSLKEFGQAPSFLLVADDVIGGFYLLNGGGLGKDLGKIYYLSPDNLKYEPLEITYTEFLQFCFNEDLDKFYKAERWTNWRDDVSKLGGDMVFSFYPYLWTKEGKDINQISRKTVPVEEQYNLNLQMRKQLSIDR